jgi:hypothetical protein
MCCSSEIPAVPTENVGVTVVLASRVTVQVPLPVQVPDHPEKVVPVEGTAVNTTLAPLVKSAVQVPGQSIPAGLLVTVPEPLPVLSTVSAIVVGAGFAANVALTLSAAFIETVHVAALPLQAPVQSVNLEPVVGASVSLTDVPSLNFALHVLPHLIPAGLLVMVPAPVPALWMVSSSEVVARATFVIPHRPRNNPRQQRLPGKDFTVYMPPPRTPKP